MVDNWPRHEQTVRHLPQHLSFKQRDPDPHDRGAFLASTFDARTFHSLLRHQGNCAYLSQRSTREQFTEKKSTSEFILEEGKDYCKYQTMLRCIRGENDKFVRRIINSVTKSEKTCFYYRPSSLISNIDGPQLSRRTATWGWGKFIDELDGGHVFAQPLSILLFDRWLHLLLPLNQTASEKSSESYIASYRPRQFKTRITPSDLYMAPCTTRDHFQKAL